MSDNLLQKPINLSGFRMTQKNVMQSQRQLLQFWFMCPTECANCCSLKLLGIKSSGAKLIYFNSICVFSSLFHLLQGKHFLCFFFTIWRKNLESKHDIKKYICIVQAVTVVTCEDKFIRKIQLWFNCFSLVTS